MSISQTCTDGWMQGNEHQQVFTHMDQPPQPAQGPCCLSPPCAVGEAPLPAAPLGPVLGNCSVPRGPALSPALQGPLTSAEQREQAPALAPGDLPPAAWQLPVLCRARPRPYCRAGPSLPPSLGAEPGTSVLHFTGVPAHPAPSAHPVPSETGWSCTAPSLGCFTKGMNWMDLVLALGTTWAWPLTGLCTTDHHTQFSVNFSLSSLFFISFSLRMVQEV